jgi:hypothetical protein
LCEFDLFEGAGYRFIGGVVLLEQISRLYGFAFVHGDHFEAFGIQEGFEGESIEFFAFVEVELLLVFCYLPLFPFDHLIEIFFVASQGLWSFFVFFVFVKKILFLFLQLSFL